MFTRCSVVFRVDGGHIPGISFGHVFRCLGLADELRHYHVKAIFVMKDYREGVDLVKRKGFENVMIVPDVGPHEDAQFTANIVREAQVRGVIFDLPAVRQEYLDALPNDTASIVLDDTGQKAVSPDLLINGSIVQAFHFYLNAPFTDYLLGKCYAMLGRDFDALPTRRLHKDVTRVSIFFGGSDPENLTTKVAQSLCHLSHSWLFQVIVGPGFADMPHLSPLLNEFPTSFVLWENVKNMAQCFFYSDIVITAGGITLYELAATGTPTIVIPSIRHEEQAAEAFQQHGTVINLGMWGREHPHRLSIALRELIQNYELRQQMSQAGQQLIDGKGRQRVIARIIQQLCLGEWHDGKNSESVCDYPQL